MNRIDSGRIRKELCAKPSRLIIGLMSGTSADGIDAALVRVSGHGTDTKAQMLSFLFTPFPEAVREKILLVAEGQDGGAREICLLSSLLGQLYAQACLALCEHAGAAKEEIDLVGSHGQTVWHQPEASLYLGYPVRGTLQIGEESWIAQALGCPVAADFRVRDLAAGGLGAPLVPYTEYLLYRREDRTVALQNIGGIGNVTILPAGGTLEDVRAFDTGPGNMVLDALTARLTDGRQKYDAGGALAARGKVDPELLSYMLRDEYLTMPPPKTTGRERYGEPYVKALLGEAERLGVSLSDTLTTATRFTAETIARALRDFSPACPEELIVGGGGSANRTLLAFLKASLPDCRVLTQEDVGGCSDAKEAMAFAILANETLFGAPNNVPSVTGAGQYVVMGKLTF